MSERYKLKQEPVSHRWAIWDIPRGPWYDDPLGADYPDAIYYAGVPHWTTLRKAAAVMMSLPE